MSQCVYQQASTSLNALIGCMCCAQFSGPLDLENTYVAPACNTTCNKQMLVGWGRPAISLGSHRLCPGLQCHCQRTRSRSQLYAGWAVPKEMPFAIPRSLPSLELLPNCYAHKTYVCNLRPTYILWQNADVESRPLDQ